MVTGQSGDLGHVCRADGRCHRRQRTLQAASLYCVQTTGPGERPKEHAAPRARTSPDMGRYVCTDDMLP